MFGLTPRLHQLATFIKTYVAEHGGISPTHDEMMVAMGLHSKSGISRMMNELEARGVIARKKHASRSVVIRDENENSVAPAVMSAIEAYCAHTGQKPRDLITAAVGAYFNEHPILDEKTT